MKHRVVITGMGVITPVGCTVDSMWDNIKNGSHGFAPITGFDTAAYKVKNAAEVKDFDPTKYMEIKEAKRMDKFCQFVMAAAHEAMKQADLKEFNPDRAGVIVGSGIGGFSAMINSVKILNESGPNRISPTFIPSMIINMAAGQISIKYGFKGISYSPVSACSTGAHAVGEAFRQISDGRSDVVISGGSEGIDNLAIAGFTNMTALTRRNDVDRISIPFDKERDGFVIGEGAGILVMESLEHAEKRGAKIYGEVVGYGATSDAYHITAPDPSGEGGAKAIKLAMEEAGINPSDISYINAHGTSTPLNDKTETLAIKTALGEYAYKVAVSSSKSMTGHLLGAAGAVESIISIKALAEGYIPPTIGYKEPDPDCDLDYVPNKGRKADLKYAISNSLGFGGHNVTLAFKRYED